MILKGKKILIRTLEISDTDLIINWRNKDFVRKNFIYQDLFTRESHLNWYKNMVLTGRVYQFIIEDIAQNKPIGSIYLRDVDMINKKAEYGIFIGEKSALGQGFGTEAGELLLKFAFESLRLHKVFLRVFSCNKGAISSYQHIGFVQDGFFRDDIKINDQYYDIIFMSILEGDYYAKN